MYLTWLDSNSWLIEVAGVKILLDPWLVGDLSFGNAKWFFQATITNPKPIPEKIDLILLSQGLPDHAHVPTLKVLERDIKIIGSPSAARVVSELGYSDVVPLKHQETILVGDVIEIRAIPGSPTGPNQVENGYLIRDLSTRETLYYEPHGYHSLQLKDLLPIDIVITPIINIKLPLLGAVIKGQKNALNLCQWLQPKVIIPTSAGGDVSYSGLLVSLLKAEGDTQSLRKLLNANNLSTEIIEPISGERFLARTVVPCA